MPQGSFPRLLKRSKRPLLVAVITPRGLGIRRRRLVALVVVVRGLALLPHLWRITESCILDIGVSPFSRVFAWGKF